MDKPDKSTGGVVGKRGLDAARKKARQDKKKTVRAARKRSDKASVQYFDLDTRCIHIV